MIEAARQMKRLHAAASSSSAKRGNFENGEVSHRTLTSQMHHHYLATNTGTPQQRAPMMEFVPKTEKIESHEANGGASTSRQVPTNARISQQHLIPPHHLAHNRSINTVSNHLKRPLPGDDESEESTVQLKRAEDNRPPLTRGESLPAVPFNPERQTSFKEKHPVRAPSFDGKIKIKKKYSKLIFLSLFQELSSLDQVSSKVNYRCDFKILKFNFFLDFVYEETHSSLEKHFYAFYFRNRVRRRFHELQRTRANVLCVILYALSLSLAWEMKFVQFTCSSLGIFFFAFVWVKFLISIDD